MLKQALEQQFQRLRIQDPLKGLRECGWERFSAIGLPDKKAEAFRYLPLSQFYTTEFQFDFPQTLCNPDLFPECRNSSLVFINGIFMPKLSQLPKEIVVLPLAEALPIYGNFLQNRWIRAVQEEKDPFVLLNAALHGRALFVYVPPKLHLKTPIQCHQILTGPVCAAPRVHLFLGAHSEVDWIMTVQEENAGAYWVNSVLDIALEENASLRMTQLHQHLDKQTWFFETVRATLKQGSCLHGVSLSTGAKALRHAYNVLLQGERAEASLHGIWMLQENRQSHTHIHMEHVAPYCRSMQLFKGILDDLSQSSFEGKIFVHPEAQKTEAYQLNKHLLLGERAIANSKPNLEIFADDVKASHGATVSQVDPQQLFYLKARGISEPDAKQLLISGFYQEILDKIPHSFARKGFP
jgi:Fe-S cluster assembly protein SufD